MTTAPANGKKKCERCGGTGWIATEDPVLGGLIDTRCPDCRSMTSARFCWLDFGWWPQPSGHKRLLSWNAETNELAFWPLHPLEQPLILAVIPDEDEVRERLEGWADHNTTKEGLSWLASQLGGCR